MNNIEISSIYEGMRLCCNQATQLICDADLLLNNNSYSTAYSLYQLASEESSKIRILLRLAIEKNSGIILLDEQRGKYFSKLFRNHLEKIKLNATSDQNFNELADKINFPKYREDDSIQKEIDNPKESDLLKQNGFYVDIKDSKFISPKTQIGEIECKELRDIVIFRHSRMKEIMEDYFRQPEFYIKNFVADINNQINLTPPKASN